jgi:hypothetical protein
MGFIHNGHPLMMMFSLTFIPLLKLQKLFNIL